MEKILNQKKNEIILNVHELAKLGYTFKDKDAWVFYVKWINWFLENKMIFSVIFQVWNSMTLTFFLSQSKDIPHFRLPNMNF